MHPTPPHHRASSRARRASPATKTAASRASARCPHPPRTNQSARRKRLQLVSNRCCACREKSLRVAESLRDSIRAKTRPRTAASGFPPGPARSPRRTAHLPASTSDNPCSTFRPHTSRLDAHRSAAAHASTSNTRSPRSASTAARLSATVVAPTPARATGDHDHRQPVASVAAAGSRVVTSNLVTFPLGQTCRIDVRLLVVSRLAISNASQLRLKSL